MKKKKQWRFFFFFFLYNESTISEYYYSMLESFLLQDVYDTFIHTNIATNVYSEIDCLMNTLSHTKRLL